LLRSCNSQFFCVLNYWDESLASCAAPQETRLMEVNGDLGGAVPEKSSVALQGSGGCSAPPQKPARKQAAAQPGGKAADDYEYGYKPPQKRRR